MGLVNGSYAEYVSARADHLTVIPDGLELEQAAALPLVVTTGAQLIQHTAESRRRSSGDRSGGKRWPRGGVSRQRPWRACYRWSQHRAETRSGFLGCRSGGCNR
jgi:hypothetical protein